jgi:hypothetical protein
MKDGYQIRCKKFISAAYAAKTYCSHDRGVCQWGVGWNMALVPDISFGQQCRSCAIRAHRVTAYTFYNSVLLSCSYLLVLVTWRFLHSPLHLWSDLSICLSCKQGVRKLFFWFSYFVLHSSFRVLFLNTNCVEDKLRKILIWRETGTFTSAFSCPLDGVKICQYGNMATGPVKALCVVPLLACFFFPVSVQSCCLYFLPFYSFHPSLHPLLFCLLSLF